MRMARTLVTTSFMVAVTALSACSASSPAPGSASPAVTARPKGTLTVLTHDTSSVLKAPRLIRAPTGKMSVTGDHKTVARTSPTTRPCTRRLRSHTRKPEVAIVQVVNGRVFRSPA
jgi:hypothetical protein